MSFLSWLFSGRSRWPDEPALIGLTASADGRRVAGLRADGLVAVWQVGSGALLLEAEAAGPGVALSADGRALICGDGVLRDVDEDKVIEAYDFHGYPWFVGEELLRVGRGRLSLGVPGQPPRLNLFDTGLDPSAEPELQVGPRWWALLDPQWDGAWLLDPSTGALAPACPGRGPAMSGAWQGERLLLVQEGGVFTWGSAGSPEADRRHGLQTLAVAADAEGVHSLGLDAEERYEHLSPSGAHTRLPGRAPSRPQLWLAPSGPVVETWEGLAVLEAGGPRELKVPQGRPGVRPAALRGGRAPIAGGRALMGTWPPRVLRLSSGAEVSELSPCRPPS